MELVVIRLRMIPQTLTRKVCHMHYILITMLFFMVLGVVACAEFYGPHFLQQSSDDPPILRSQSDGLPLCARADEPPRDGPVISPCNEPSLK